MSLLSPALAGRFFITSATWEAPWASLVSQMVKCLPAMQEAQVQSLGQEDPLEKEMATHFSPLAWRIPWTEEPGRLQSMGSQSRTRLKDFTGDHWRINSRKNEEMESKQKQHLVVDVTGNGSKV